MNATRLFLLAAVLLPPLLPAQTMNADQLAARLRRDGVSLVRARMETGGEVLQLQIKERRGKGAADVAYEVLFPKERQGERVVLRKRGGRATAQLVTPQGKERALELGSPLLGGALACEDAVEDFFAWEQQSLAGSEEVNGVSCQVLESKPTKGRSIYGSVRTWVDPRRFVPLRVEKYSPSGKLVRRIETTRVVSDAGRPIPANLRVQAGSVTTEIDGSRIRHDVEFSDADF